MPRAAKFSNLPDTDLPPEKLMYRALELLRDFNTLPLTDFLLRHRDVPTEAGQMRRYMLALAGRALH